MPPRLAKELDVPDGFLTDDVADLPSLVTASPSAISSAAQRMILEWNRTEWELPRHRRVHQLIEQQVERQPAAVALTCGSERLTYGELNERSNRLAYALRERGVGPEVLVGLILERGPDFIVAILAVLKAGGAFLPLDLRHPGRSRDVVTESGLSLLVAHAKTRDAVADIVAELPVETRRAVLDVGTAVGCPAQNLDNLAGDLNPAYIIFTSGSTGRPKGVVVHHAGMLNHIASKIRDLEISLHDTVIQNGPATFDIVVWQCLAPLVAGGRIHVTSDSDSVDPVQLAGEVQSSGASILQVVPAVLTALVQETRCAPLLEGLRFIVPTGDALPTHATVRWLHQHPTIPLLNTYGSTECSDDQCHYLIDSVPGSNCPNIAPIGRPIANTQAYVLDNDLQPLPVGSAGELFVGGEGVSRGYLNRPELTAEKFIPDPFSGRPGARLYRTGDLARFNSDGVLEFLGRSDTQVKIRGYRVELGEIEAALVQHPDVAEAVVLARGDDPGQKRLIAYLIPAGETTPSANDARQFLSSVLPDYMIPADYLGLDSWPLTPNGKIDRKALPEPSDRRAGSDAAGSEPETPAEREVVRIWTEVLEVDEIGLHDDFFALGGHSLSAMRVVSRVRDVFGVEVPVRSLFERPTVSSLVAVIDGLRALAPASPGLVRRSRDQYRMRK